MSTTKPTTNSKTLVQIVIGLWAGVLLGAVVIGVLVYTGVIPLLNRSNVPDAGRPPALAKMESGTMAPEVALTDMEGGEVRLADYRGKLVIMNFWATWCGPCIQEMPMFQDYQDQYSNLVVLGVNSDESADKVNEFLSKLLISYPIVLDTTKGMAREFRVSFLPTTIFIDEKGEVRFRHFGIMTEEQMDYYLTQLGMISE